MSASEIERKYSDRFAKLIGDITDHGIDGIEAAGLLCARGLLSICRTLSGDDAKALEGASAAINDVHRRNVKKPS